MSDAEALGSLRSPDVAGRLGEQARLGAFLEAVGFGARAFQIRGEPGIGKTTLWRQALAEGRRAGYEVLVTRPAEEERLLAAGGLVDLFEAAGIDPVALRADGDPGLRGRATLATVRRLVEGGPALVAVDDVQWLDSASARALRYALRRLDSEPVGLVTTLRAGSADPLAPAGLMPPGRAEALDLLPLGLSDLRGVLRRTVTAISRPGAAADLRGVRGKSTLRPRARAKPGRGELRGGVARRPAAPGLAAGGDRRASGVRPR